MFANRRPVWDASDCALLFIDYQPELLRGVHSGDPALIELNARMLAKAAAAFKIPIILSTIGVEMKVNTPTVELLKKELPGVDELDRSSMNAWEDEAFLRAVKATGRKRLVFCALYTEICLTYPVLEALADQYEVTIIVDAVGGQSKLEHEMAVWRLVHAGAVPNTTTAMVTEWFRDWKSPQAEKGRELLQGYLRDKAPLLNPGAPLYEHSISGHGGEVHHSRH